MSCSESRRLIATLALCAAAAPMFAHAQSQADNKNAQAILESSNRHLASPEGQKQLKVAKAIADNSAKKAKEREGSIQSIYKSSTERAEQSIKREAAKQGKVGGSEDPTAELPSIHIDVLATNAILPDVVDSLIGESFRMAGLYPTREIQLRALLRGLPKGYKTVADFAVALKALQDKIVKANIPQNTSVYVAIDPRPFRDNPSMLGPLTILTVEGQPPVTVTGLVVGEWLMDQFERGTRGSIGVMGPTVDIVEPDMMDYIKQRLASIDWEQKQKEAEHRYWATLAKPVIDLPLTKVPAVRYYDPSFEATSDIRLPDSSVLIKAGTRINPLEIKPYPRALLFFDPGSQLQLDAVKAYAAKSKKPVKYIASRIAFPGEEDAITAHAKAEDLLGGRVYLYEDRLFSVFALKSFPAAVEQEGSVWKITTLATAISADQPGKAERP
ncbi:MAG: hypothetical protein E6Q76_07435 [Rhizobium sp.]|nr:MAG: hypothetical protein E6Q76_07435 [Rhizobium sp.]